MKGPAFREKHLPGANDSQPSEAQHTTDLYRKEDQEACDNKDYFFVVLVQLSHSLRSAWNARICDHYVIYQ
jgi:hypothetical protein